jgi:CheY-like chemotaxis protein
MRRVLVVDDDRLVGSSLARLLRKTCAIDLETEARAAVARAEAGQSWDVILCDLMMPGMSGMELHAVFSQRFPELAKRMVFMTGGLYTDEAESFLGDGRLRRLDKPFERESVLAMLEQVANSC